MKKGANLYVVEALRWGDRENHSYVVGVYADMDQAYKASQAEQCWRGGKYSCEINTYQIGEIEGDKLKHLNGEIV